MELVSRRTFLGGLAALGIAPLMPEGKLAAQGPAAKLTGKINVHHHLTGPAYAKFLTENKLRDFPNKSAAEGIEDMDKAGISTAFTSIIGPGIWFGDIAATKRLARECNEYAAKLVADYPGRFGMFASLPLPDIDGCLREIEYAYDTLKTDGIYLFTNFGQNPLYGDKYLGDPMLAPIYQELNRRKAVIYTHPKDSACCREIVPGVGGAIIEFGTDTTRSIVSLVKSGTAAKYPDISFIFSHAGGTAPFLVSRIIGGNGPVLNPIAAYLRDGGVLKPGAPAPNITPEMPKGALYEMQKFYYDTAQAENQLSLGALRRMVPMSHILFGTDYPFLPGDGRVKQLETSEVFNERELHSIYRDNPTKLLPRLRS